MARNLRIEEIGAVVSGRWDDLSYQVAQAVPVNHTKSHPSISLGTIRKIKRLRQEGHKIAWIARELPLPVKTVGYWPHKK